MKPTLSNSLRAIVFALSSVSLAQADYNGGQIINQEGTVQTGDIVIDYTIDGAETFDRSGGIELSGTEGKGKTTALEGNFTINARGDSDRNNGILIAADPGKDADWDIDDDPEYNATVILKTQGADDKITINVDSLKGCGVNSFSESSKVVLDASSSSTGVVINLLNTGDSVSSGRGLTTDFGVIEVKGDLTVNAYGENQMGILSHGSTGNISVSGTTVLNYEQEAAYAIRASSGKVTLADVRINKVNMGLWANDGGDVYISGDLAIGELTGVNARAIRASTAAIVHVAGHVSASSTLENSIGILANDKGTVTVHGGTTLDTVFFGVRADTNGVVNVYSSVDISSGRGVITDTEGVVNMNGSGKITGSVFSVVAYNGSAIDMRGSYNIMGRVHAADTVEGYSGASVNLALNNASLLNGFTTLGAGDGIIGMSLEGRSQWLVTANSTLTTLSLDDTSWLSFSLLDSGMMLFANINAASIALADGAVLQLLGVKSTDFDTMGRALTTFTASLLNAGTLTVDGVKLVTEDNYELTFTNNTDGTFTVTGVTTEQLFIPEPATAALGLLGLASLMLRRRKI